MSSASLALLLLLLASLHIAAVIAQDEMTKLSFLKGNLKVNIRSI